MAKAKAAAAVSSIDPAALGALIPNDDQSDDSTDEREFPVERPTEDTPVLLRHEPMPPPPSQSPGNFQSARRKAGVTTATPPVPVQPRRDIARMLPSSHRVYVYRKKTDGSESGKVGFLNDYSAQDLEGTGTIEAFIKRYVVPQYGYGEFHIHYYEPGKAPSPIGMVNIEAPLGYSSPSSDRRSPASEMLHELTEMKKNQATAPVAKTVFESQMEGMMASMVKTQMDKMSSGESSKDGGMGSMMMMMLLEKMKPAAPQVDLGTQRLMEKLSDRLESMEQEFRMSQSMVPPPSSQSEGHPFEFIMEAMKENTKVMVEAMRAQQVTRDPIKDFADIAQLINPKNSDSLTIKDLFELMPKFKAMTASEASPNDSFQTTMQNLRTLRLVQQEFGDGGRSSAPDKPEENFWTFAKGMLQSDIGKSIAGQIIQQGAGKEIATRQSARSTNAHTAAQQVSQRRAAHASQQRQLAEQNAEILAQRAKSAQLIAQKEAQQALQAPEVPQVPEATKEPQQEPQQEEPQQEEEEQDEEEGGEVDVPEGFLNVHLPNINGAATDAERIGAIITGFQVLAMSADFRPVISKMFGLCKQNRRIEALDHLQEILQFFSDNKVLDENIPELAKGDFDRHWDLIRQRLEFPDVPEVQPDESEDESEDESLST